MVLQSALDLLFKELWEIIFHYRNALFNSVWHYLDSSNHPNTYHIQKRWTSNCTPLNGKLVTIGPRNVTSNRAPLDLGPRRCCWSWASWWSRPPSDTQRAGWIERDFFQQVGDDIPLSSRSHAAIGIQSNVLGITSTVAWVWSHSWHSKGWTGHCWNILTLILKSQFDELTSYQHSGLNNSNGFERTFAWKAQSWTQTWPEEIKFSWLEARLVKEVRIRIVYERNLNSYLHHILIVKSI